MCAKLAYRGRRVSSLIRGMGTVLRIVSDEGMALDENKVNREKYPSDSRKLGASWDLSCGFPGSA